MPDTCSATEMTIQDQVRSSGHPYLASLFKFGVAARYRNKLAQRHTPIYGGNLRAHLKKVRGGLFLDEYVFLALFFGHILFHKKPFPSEWVHLCVIHQARIGGWGWGKDLDLFWVDLEVAAGKRF